MKLLDTYLFKTVLAATGMVLLALLGMESFVLFAQELQTIGTGNYGLWHVFVYVLSILPINAYQFFPIGVLLGSLVGLGRLASTSELTVMRCSGVSKCRVTWAVIKAALFMLVFAILLGEVMGPYFDAIGSRYKAQAMSAGQAIGGGEGAWVRDGDSYLHVQHVANDNKLQGVLWYQFHKGHLQSVRFAKDAVRQHGQWVFQHVVESKMLPNRVVSEKAAQQSWPVKLNPHILSSHLSDPNQQTLLSLYRFLHYRRLAGLASDGAAVVFWQRIFAPLATLVMICLAIPFIFGSLRTVGMGVRLVVGVAAGFCFYIINTFVGPFSAVYQLPAFFVALSPIVLFALIGMFLLRFSR